LGRIVTIALWRANNKPPVELVVANFVSSVYVLLNLNLKNAVSIIRHLKENSNWRTKRENAKKCRRRIMSDMART
jgi:hypothetical protein